MSFWKRLFGTKQSPESSPAGKGSVNASAPSGSLSAAVSAWDSDGLTPLQKAAKEGNKASAETLLSMGADVDAKVGGRYQSTEGQTALHLAAEAGHTEIVSLLLSSGANPNTPAGKTDCNLTPLHVAAEKGHTELAETLVAKGADINATTKYYGGRQTAIQRAAEGGHPDIVALLLANNAKTDGAMSSASRHCRKQIVELLIDNGVDFNIFDVAAIGDYERLSEFLKRNRSLAVSEDEYYKYTPLHWAAGTREPALAELLIKSGADVSAKNDHGETPLYLAARNGQTAAAACLLASGADVNVKDNYGKTPLHEALSYEKNGSSLEIVGLLLRSGAGLAAKNKYGDMPLHLAALKAGKSQESKEVMRLLLSGGADVNAKGQYSMTALHRAAYCGDLELVRTLVFQGADVNAKDESGQTPVFKANRESHFEVAKFLNEHGFIDPYPPCPECGERSGPKSEYFELAASFSCPDCEEPLRVPAREVDKQRGLDVMCASCRATSFIPPSVWCGNCGLGLSNGWQKRIVRR